MRCDPNKKITLDVIVGRLIAFELDNYDNYVPSSKGIESLFEANISLKKKVLIMVKKNSPIERLEGVRNLLAYATHRI